MDISQFQPIIENLLNQSLAPNNIEQVKHILQMIIKGVDVLGKVLKITDFIIANYPEFILLAKQLLDLIIAGASIHDIALLLLKFAISHEISIDIVIRFLQMIGGIVGIL
ncbi:hypothetical protein [Nostoc sp. CCY0012]|uniref:hypothetical protein n=1 Tax=Nostoc sp. CCY0012 TaxID=1056123 RepID=UPI0039C6B8C7